MPKPTPGKKKKPEFVRTDISRSEKRLGAVILVLLTGVGVAVGIKGRLYDPTRFSVDPATLEFTRTAVEGKAATLRADDGMRSFETQTRAEPADSAALELAVEGLEPMGPTEHYIADTLFEKINGRAPAYHEFGFQELTSRSFTIDGEEGQYLDVYVYTMDNPINAFGIFAMERGATGEPVDFALDGYRSEMGYFFRQGSSYVQVLASDVDEAVMAQCEKGARALAGEITADDTGIEARNRLPVDGQLPGSVSFIRQNAYGQAALRDTFEARYKVGDSELTYFAVEDSEGAFEALRDFYQNFGTIEESGELAGRPYFVGDSFGQVSVIHQDGTAVAGVMNADDADVARSFVEKVLSQP